MAHTYSIGIDIGGTNTDMGLVRDDGIIIARSNMPTNAYIDLQPYIRDMMACIEKMMKDMEVSEIEGIGIGAPNGNYYTGCVDNAPNLTIKGVLNFEKEIHQYMNVPVVLSNDANAAAYGEMVYGGAKGLRHFIMFTLGTGVGSGIVIDGKLIHGSTGAAGELGHSILIPNGRKCSCGRYGCLETYTSARGIVQTYFELKGTPISSDIDSKAIGDLANQRQLLGSRGHLPDGRTYQSGRTAAQTAPEGLREIPAQHLRRQLYHPHVAAESQRSGHPRRRRPHQDEDLMPAVAIVAP